MIWQRKAALLILAVAALLRLYRLDQYPLPMHQDELSDAYDAWSIVETGADRAGTSRPVIVRALGEVDYRPALNAWITAIPMNVTGFSPVAARIPTAILGIATLALTFLFASLLVSETFGLVALSVAAFNPWHLTYSRFAHQGGMLPAFFSILTLLIWLRAAELATRARISLFSDLFWDFRLIRIKPPGSSRPWSCFSLPTTSCGIHPVEQIS